MNNNYVLIDPELPKELSSNESIVVSIADVTEFKDGQRTKNIIGKRVQFVVLQGKLNGKSFSVKVPDINEIQVGTRIYVEVLNAKIYAKSSKNTSFATIEISLNGAVHSIANGHEVSKK